MLLGVDELRLADARAGTVVNLWAFVADFVEERR